MTKVIFHTIWHHAQQKKLSERRRKAGHSWLWCLSSQLTITSVEVLLSRQWLNPCLPMEHSEWTFFFFSYFALHLFIFLFKCYCVSPQAFFPSLYFLPALGERGMSKLGKCLTLGHGHLITLCDFSSAFQSMLIWY